MAARNKKAASSGTLRTFYLVLGALALVGVGALAYVVLSRGAGTAVEPVELAIQDPRVLYEKAQGMVKGPANAPVKLVVFSDYMCPYCGQFAAQVQPLLETNYVQAGKLQIVYYDFPLGGEHKHSFLAARAARCAGEAGKFWEYQALLFGRLSEWGSAEGSPVGRFRGYASELGLDAAEFERCLESDRHAELVSANRLLGLELGVSATPWVIVNGRRIGNALNYRELKEVIDQELGA